MSLRQALADCERARSMLSFALEHQKFRDDKGADIFFAKVRLSILKAEKQIEKAIGGK